MVNQYFPPEIPQVGQKIRIIISKSPTNRARIPECVEGYVMGRAIFSDCFSISLNYYYDQRPLSFDFDKKQKIWQIGSHKVDIYILD